MADKKNTIGRFEIIEKIGEGPIGAVYKALDPVIRRTVAIKVIKLYALEESATFADVFEKIYRVVRASSQLNHPNICIIYDLSEEKKIPYITMEFVDGRDVESMLQKKHQFKRAELLNILQQTCDAIDFAHKKNVIHQDLKSTNLLLTSDLHVKITDFGIAGLDEIAAAQTKKLLSIPFYISPEQALGEKVTSASDLFSLGIIIYQLLSGQLPFPGTSAANVIMMIARDNPAVPKDIDRSGIPRADWESFFSIALAKSPNQRFHSAKEMLDAATAMLPKSETTYYPYSFSGDASDTFEKTYVNETPTMALDSAQIMEELDDQAATITANRADLPIPLQSGDAGATIPSIAPNPESSAATVLIQKPQIPEGYKQGATLPPNPEPPAGSSAPTQMMQAPQFPPPPSAPSAPTQMMQAPQMPSESSAPTTLIPVPQKPAAPKPPAPPPSAPTQLIQQPQMPPPSSAPTTLIPVPQKPAPKPAEPEAGSPSAPTQLLQAPGTVPRPAPSAATIPPTPPKREEPKPAPPPQAAPPQRPAPAPVPVPPPPAPPPPVEQPTYDPVAAAAAKDAGRPATAPKAASGPPNMGRYLIGAVIVAILIALIGTGILLLKKRSSTTTEPQQTQQQQQQQQQQQKPKNPITVPPTNQQQQQQQQQQIAEVTSGQLTISSDPAGATVLVNDQPKGVTPVNIPDLPLGNYSVKLQLQGYQDMQQDVAITKESPNQEIPFTLQKTAAVTGTLVIDSTPPGATIVIGKRALGVTPKKLPNTKVGKYNIILKLQGYEDYNGSVKVTENQTSTLTAQLQEIPKPKPPEPVVVPEAPKEPEVKPGQLVTLGSPGVIPPKAIKKTSAKYPDSARSRKLEGVVSMSLLVSETGQVTEVKVVQSANPILDDAAVTAVKQWLFQPATKNGVPVKVWYPVSMSFQQAR